MKIKPAKESVPARVLKAAVDCLAEWERGCPLNQLSLPPEQARTLTDLLHAYFRHLARLDCLIDRSLTRPHLAPPLRQILRLGLCSCFYQHGLPQGAAVDACVWLAKARHGDHAGGFVNAILRKTLRDGTPDSLGSEFPPFAQLELSPELYAQWQALPTAELAALANLLQSPAPIIVRARQPAGAELPAVDSELLAELPAPDWAPQARLWRCLKPAEFLDSPAFADGHFYVQDPSTLLAPMLLAPRPGETVADLCAAPGGKTLLLDELAGGQACLVAADRSLGRLRTVRRNLAPDSGVHLLVADASRPPFQNAVAAVLLDVPCSNTGVVRRRPDIRWRFTRQGLQELVGLQQRILAGAAASVAPGGRLVYSTCSLEAQENRRQIDHFLLQHPNWRLENERQLFPTTWHDGAYAALLRHAG